MHELFSFPFYSFSEFQIVYPVRKHKHHIMMSLCVYGLYLLLIANSSVLPSVTTVGLRHLSFLNISIFSLVLPVTIVACFCILACTSAFPKSASDHGLIVANGTYALTAGNCVQCSCGPGNLK